MFPPLFFLEIDGVNMICNTERGFQKFRDMLGRPMLPLVLASVSAVLALPDGAFLEKNNLLIIEAESFFPDDAPVGSCQPNCNVGWHLDNVHKGYDGSEFTGRGYLRWEGGNFFNSPTNGTLPAGRCKRGSFFRRVILTEAQKVIRGKRQCCLRGSMGRSHRPESSELLRLL